MILSLPSVSLGFGIVNNSGSTAADSQSVPFYLLDSAGNMTATTTNDSMFLVVFYPSGAEAFRDTVAHGSSLITSVTVAGYTVYNWKMAIADIDGSGKDGLYSYIIFAKDHTGAALATPHKGYFQLYQSYDYNVWAGRIIDSLQAIIDTLQNQDDWVAQQAEVANLDGWNPITDNDSLIIDGSTTQSLNIGINWADITNTTSALTLSNTIIGRSVLVTQVEDLADSAIDAASIRSNTMTSAKMADNVFNSDKIDGTFREEIWNIPFSDAATVNGSMWDSLNNATYVQGGAGLDSTTIARWVWNTPQSNHTVAGTFGKYLDAEISGIGGGSGAYSFKIVTYDSSISQIIPGVALAVRNVDQSALVAVGMSDVTGRKSFNLDADSFIVVAQAPGYLFNTFDTLVVTGAGTDTLFGDQFDPGAPISPSLCRVYGYVYSVDAVPDNNATVNAYLPSGVARSGNLIISPFSVTTISDSLGYFYLDLIRSDSLIPTGTMYDFIINREDGTVVHKRVTVPDSSSWLLNW